MVVKKKGLGRGLDALLGAKKELGTIPESVTVTETVTTEYIPQDGDLRQMPIEYLQRGKYQPRRDMTPEALEDLANSIKSQGVMQPIIIRPIGNKKYEIIAGERRWRASQLAGLDKVPVIIKDVPDEAAIAMALIENIQREDLNPIEEAFALQRLQIEFELTQQEVADAVGKSRTTITNLLRLMNLKEDVRKMLEHGDIEMGHARAILGLDVTQQSQAAKIVVSKGLSVRQTESLVRKIQEEAITGKPSQTEPSNDIINLEEELSAKIGSPVTIAHGAKGKGKLTIKYSSLDELDGLLVHLRR